MFSAINKQENVNHEKYLKACEDHKHDLTLKEEYMRQGVEKKLILSKNIFLRFLILPSLIILNVHPF